VTRKVTVDKKWWQYEINKYKTHYFPNFTGTKNSDRTSNWGGGIPLLYWSVSINELGRH